MFGISFSCLCLYYSSPKWDCVEIWAVPHVANESHMIVRCMSRKTGTPTDGVSHASHWSTASLLRWDSQDSRVARDSRCYIIQRPKGGNRTLQRTYIDLSNLCHFLRNIDSKYCFLRSNCRSSRLKRGHLLIFRATFIFLHRASKALSRAANSFMLVSWSRFIRNIHS